jgi:hypothetical protein
MLPALAFIVATTVTLEERAAPNSVGVELLGQGFLWSLTYERFLTDRVSVRAGIGGLRLGHDDLAYVAVPVSLSYLYGKRDHFIELGAGFTYAYTAGSTFDDGLDKHHTAIIGGLFGYRYAPFTEGFTFRAALMPAFTFHGGGVWAGLLFGYLF